MLKEVSSNSRTNRPTHWTIVWMESSKITTGCLRYGSGHPVDEPRRCRAFTCTRSFVPVQWEALSLPFKFVGCSTAFLLEARDAHKTRVWGYASKSGTTLLCACRLAKQVARGFAKDLAAIATRRKCHPIWEASTPSFDVQIWQEGVILATEFASTMRLDRVVYLRQRPVALLLRKVKPTEGHRRTYSFFVMHAAGFMSHDRRASSQSNPLSRRQRDG